MPGGVSIKSRYKSWLRAFVALDALVVFASFSGSEVLGAIEERQWIEIIDLKHVLKLALPMATLILDGLATPDLKAVLVYWKWRKPLPSHEAFSIHGRRDGRVDMEALQEKHGPLPTAPDMQEVLWYKLSKVTADRATVDEVHYSWLLMRDLTNLSFGLWIVNAAITGVLRVGWSEWILLVVAQGLLYVVLSQIAANKGIRFVTTVLAEAAAAVNPTRC